MFVVYGCKNVKKVTIQINFLNKKDKITNIHLLVSTQFS